MESMSAFSVPPPAIGVPPFWESRMRSGSVDAIADAATKGSSRRGSDWSNAITIDSDDNILVIDDDDSDQRKESLSLADGYTADDEVRQRPSFDYYAANPAAPTIVVPSVHKNFPNEGLGPTGREHVDYLRKKLWRLRGEVYDTRVELRRALFQRDVWHQERQSEWAHRRGGKRMARGELDSIDDPRDEFDEKNNKRCRIANREEETQYLCEARRQQYRRNERETDKPKDFTDSDDDHSNPGGHSSVTSLPAGMLLTCRDSL